VKKGEYEDFLEETERNGKRVKGRAGRREEGTRRGLLRGKKWETVERGRQSEGGKREKE
jgi:hypothetical protein